MTVPTESAQMGLRIRSVNMVHSSGELDEYAFGTAGLSILQGVRNSSKTTTLKVIDYCLGNRDSPAEALKAAVADEYVEVSTQLSINGQPVEIRRSLQHGRQSKVVLNGDEFTVGQFSDRILRELGWPAMNIPKGVQAANAIELVPLSFRSILRHIYRNEDSWTQFADKEQEYLRRAVVSYLLGFAPLRYGNNEFALASAQRRLVQAQAAEREVHDSTDRAVLAICENLHLPMVRTQQEVIAARGYLQDQCNVVEEQRRQLTHDVQLVAAGRSEGASTLGYDATLSRQYESASQALAQATAPE
jgi:hypothetical protein